MKTKLLMFITLLLIACNKDDSPASPDPDPVQEPDPMPDPENQAPGAFSLLEINNNSINVEAAPTFSWNASTDPDGDAVTYDLYLDKEANPMTKVVEGISETSFKLPNTMALALVQDYYWKVVAKDGKGGETASEIFTFKVKKLDDAQQLIVTNAFDPVERHASVVFDGAMYVLGGFSDSGFSDDSWASNNGTTWGRGVAQASEKFTARFYHAASTFNDNIWIAGGSVGGNFSNDIWHSADGTIWEELAQTTPFTVRQEHTLTGHAGKLWVIGGNTSDNGNAIKLADVWSSVDGSDWNQTIAEAPFGKRNFHQTVSFQGKLWVIGGIDEDENGNHSFKNDVWSSADGAIWQPNAQNAEFSPRGFQALVFNDKIWVIGGAGAEGTLNDIWYSEDGIEWINATPENSFPAIDGFTALFYDNKIWILGGSISNEVWSIDYHELTD